MVLKLTMSKLILENKGALARGITKHPRTVKKWWEATADAAAVAHSKASVALQQPFRTNCQQLIPPSSELA